MAVVIPPVITVGKLVLRPLFPDLFRPQTDQEFAELVASVKLRGVEQPIHVDEDGGIISGNHRALACMVARLGEKALPRIVCSGLTFGEKRRLAEDLNDLGRLRSRAEVERDRRHRDRRIQEKREEGKSTRTIAAEEGVCQTTVRRALEADAADGAAADEPHTITGRDGKTYQVKPRRPRVDDPLADDEAQDREGLHDALGLPVEAEEWLVLEQFQDARRVLRELEGILDGLAGAKGGEVFADHAGAGRAALAELRTVLERCRPHAAVCPWCHAAKGDKYRRNLAGCPECRGRPYVVREQWDRAPAEARRDVEALVQERIADALLAGQDGG